MTDPGMLSRRVAVPQGTGEGTIVLTLVVLLARSSRVGRSAGQFRSSKSKDCGAVYAGHVANGGPSCRYSVPGAAVWAPSWPRGARIGRIVRIPRRPGL